MRSFLHVFGLTGPGSLQSVDTSRNGRRAYCSVRCANNDAVARHRERLHGDARPSTARKTWRT
ncbi:CGNR zinc finger domain-containing protein [Streptomyces sp. NPDC059474]|uniref:CGNR zinc finger domain-containing protein n=1 Tax=Streptomyces sp. NPDC059474 TaxID=3346846 RepID=UPI0036A6B529